MAISKRIRYEVLRRDNNTCRYCHATDSQLTIDHVTPIALGGSDDPSNLVACCKDCNAGKTSSTPDAPLVAQVSDDAVRWATAMTAAADRAAADLRVAQAYVDQVDAHWSRWTYANDHPIPRSADWPATLDRWYRAGMPVELVIDSANKALGNDRIRPADTWRYFCGIVWKRLTKLQEEAHAELLPTSSSASEVCGHCETCVQTQDDPDSLPSDFLWCEVFTRREDDEDPHQPCSVCGKLQCAPGIAREGGLRDGYTSGVMDKQFQWRGSFLYLQQRALLEATSPGVRLARPH